DDANKIAVPKEYKNIKNVVMCGMGGSGLGARVIESVFASDLNIPLVRVNDYHIPRFVDSDTLVICSSYSGETEETLQNANEAIAKKVKCIVIANGGRLIDLAKENKLPFYDIEPNFNPSDQPRMAIGYSIVGQLVLSSKTGLFNFRYVHNRR
ncbi:MAG: SIS domain-containing protein, partial [Ignavibacteria bacterium]|nr:SIS domain-containing protein [Ignavibacteria bacterium]